jgi:hypothetical protein
LFFHEKALELEERKAILQVNKLGEAFFGKPEKGKQGKSPSEQMREIYGPGRVVTR